MKKGKKLIALIVGVLMIVALAVTVAACGGPEKDEDLIYVGVINNPPGESSYRTANVNDFAAFFTEANGYVAYNSYDGGLDAQLRAFNQYVNLGVDYILLSASQAAGWDDAIASATKAGIPVILFDRMIENDGYTAAVVSKMAEQGTTAVNWLLDLELPAYNVIHIQGEVGSDAQIGRSKALTDAAAVAANNLTIVKTGTGGKEWSATEAVKVLESVIPSGFTSEGKSREQIMEALPFNVVYAENDGMAAGVVGKLKELGIPCGYDKTEDEINGVIVMGFDCTKSILQDMLDLDIYSLNYNGQCSPFQAKKIDEIIKNLEKGTKPTEKVIYSVEVGIDAKTITQADVDGKGI